MTEEAYFEMLARSPIRYEYWNGFAVAMAGGQPIHSDIEGNIFGELYQKLKGSTCRPVVSNQAVKLARDTGYVFPDTTVVCGQPEYVMRNGIGCLLNPTVVVEILSPSTAAFDDSEKLHAYTSLRTVREYLIVASDRPFVKLYFRRAPDETWGVRLFSRLADAVGLESIGCSLTLAEIYAGVSYGVLDQGMSL